MKRLTGVRKQFLTFWESKCNKTRCTEMVKRVCNYKAECMFYEKISFRFAQHLQLFVISCLCEITKNAEDLGLKPEVQWSE